MSRSNPNSVQNTGPSLFPLGLLMYDLPSSRRTTSRTTTNTESVASRQTPLPRKQSSSPIPPSSSSASSIADDDDDDLSIENESEKKNLTTTEDWWRQAIEPIPSKTISTSHSAFSMIDDDDDISNDTNQLFSLLPSFNSTEKIIVHNQSLINLTQIYTDKAKDYVTQWYKNHSIPNLTILIKRGLLKIHKERSIRMVITNKKDIFGQLDKNGQILSNFDNRLFDSIENFYQAYQSRRKRNENLAMIYESVHWYDRSFHDILLEYAETIVKIPGMKTRLIAENELLPVNSPIDVLSKEMLCQINCWNDDRNEIEL